MKSIISHLHIFLKRLPSGRIKHTIIPESVSLAGVLFFFLHPYNSDSFQWKLNHLHQTGGTPMLYACKMENGRGSHCSGALPDKNRHSNSVLSPDAVVGLFFPDSVVSVVHVNDQVLVSVVRWAEVGDHTAGDPQETHHWTQTQRSQTTIFNNVFSLFYFVSFFFSTSISFSN